MEWGTQNTQGTSKGPKKEYEERVRKSKKIDVERVFILYSPCYKSEIGDFETLTTNSNGMRKRLVPFLNLYRHDAVGLLWLSA